MHNNSHQNAEDVVRSFLQLADRVRQYITKTTNVGSSGQIERANIILAEIESSIVSTRSSIEEIRLASTRPKTDRNISFISKKKNSLAETYRRLELKVEELDSGDSHHSEIALDSESEGTSSQLHGTHDLIRDITNRIKIAIGSTEYEPKKIMLRELLTRIESGKIGRGMLERIRDRIAENPAIPASSIEEIKDLMNDY